jgi:hypothetical protein
VPKGKKVSKHELVKHFQGSMPNLQEAVLGEGHPEESKFEEYTFPGGHNYREVLMHLPKRKGEKSWGWHDPRTGESENGFIARYAAEDSRPSRHAVVREVEEESPDNYESGRPPSYEGSP